MKKVYTFRGTPTKRNLTMHCMQAHKASNTKMVRVAGECYRAKGLKHQMCQLFLDIYKAIGLKYASSHSGRRTCITPGKQGCRRAIACSASRAFTYILNTEGT